MNARFDNLVQFLARYALYLVIPGLWLAYVGGAAPWIGGTAGFLGAVMLGFAIRCRRRRTRRGERERLDDLLSE